MALALRYEVLDLETAGIGAIQIDEPALREGLPLRQGDWAVYLDWAVDSSSISASGVRDDTQIHTRMCYSEFNDVIEAAAAMDADVISIETSRSRMELLDVFVKFRYPNEIGPGDVPSGGFAARFVSQPKAEFPKSVGPDAGKRPALAPESSRAAKRLNLNGLLDFSCAYKQYISRSEVALLNKV